MSAAKVPAVQFVHADAWLAELKVPDRHGLHALELLAPRSG
jgi:hypothetical protein